MQANPDLVRAGAEPDGEALDLRIGQFRAGEEIGTVPRDPSAGDGSAEVGETVRPNVRLMYPARLSSGSGGMVMKAGTTSPDATSLLLLYRQVIRRPPRSALRSPPA